MNLGLDTRQLLIKQMRWEAEDVLSLRLECAEGNSLASWQPGAHIDVHLASQPELLRQYSLCGDPNDGSCYRVAVLRERSADRGGSRYVHEELRPGHQIAVALPRNNFELIESPRYLFLAGGIGITPLLPMIAEADRRGAAWELHYGGRSRASMAFLDELAPYGHRVHLVFGQPLEVEVLLRETADNTLVYACGPTGLLDAVESVAHLLPEGAIRLERFKGKQSGPTQSQDQDTPVRVLCEQSGTAVTVDAGEPILDALEKAGVEVVSSCREGVCGTCETAVIRGVPDHRDSVLTTDERQAGDTMMICVSRGLTDELVLDI
jgi:ferredoxin-NADP reductase